MIERNDTQDPSRNTGHDSAGSYLGHLWASIAMTVTLGIICCGVYPLVVYTLAQLIFPNQANGSLVKKDGTYTTKDEEAVGSSLLGQNFSLPGYFHPRPSAAGNGYDPTSSGGSNLGPLSDKLINGATQAPATQPTTAPSVASTAPTTAPEVVAVPTTAPAVASSVASTAPATTQPGETLAYDGIRLRTIHYATDNNIPFRLYQVADDGTKTVVPLSKYSNADGSLNDIALVDAFPHNGVTAGLIAADFGTLIPADAVTASGSGLDPHISPDNALLQAQRVADARHMKVDDVKKLIEEHTDNPSLGILGDPGVNVLMLNLALDKSNPLPAPAPAAAAPATQPSGK